MRFIFAFAGAKDSDSKISSLTTCSVQDYLCSFYYLKMRRLDQIRYLARDGAPIRGRP